MSCLLVPGADVFVHMYDPIMQQLTVMHTVCMPWIV